MEGFKQCPECQSADVPASAEICPFCGHSFGKQPVSKPVEKKTEKPREAEGPLNLSDDLPFNQLGYGNIPDEQPKKVEPVTVADKVQDQGSTVPVSGDNTLPSSTEYKTYKKKGIIGKKERTDSNAPGQDQGSKVVMCGLLTALAVAALCVARVCVYSTMIYRGGGNSIVWNTILYGIILASIHRCCFDNAKGSRKAGFLGIIAGYGYCLVYFYSKIFYNGLQNWIFTFMLVQVVTYAVCWFMTAKLAKNSKSAKTFLLTAAEVVLLPIIVNKLWGWLIYRSDWNWQINWQMVALDCVVMLLTEFLLYRIQKWLALKPRKLFWVLYAVIVIGALLYMHQSLKIGRIRLIY